MVAVVAAAAAAALEVEIIARIKHHKAKILETKAVVAIVTREASVITTSISMGAIMVAVMVGVPQPMTGGEETEHKVNFGFLM